MQQTPEPPSKAPPPSQTPGRPSGRAPTLRLRSPAEVVESVPYVLGFHPSDSLVLMSLRGSRLGLCMRADLPDPAADQEVADYVVSKLHVDGATAALLVVYGPDTVGADSARPSRRGLVEACARLLDESGVPLRDALQVADGRWWSYLCDDPGCCPAEGTPVPRPGRGESAAAWAMAGRAALPDRASVVSGLEPPRGVRARELRRTLRRVRAEVRKARGRGGASAYAQECLAMFRRAVEVCEHPRGQVDDEQAARLALALRETTVRDEVVLWATGPRREALGRLLRDVLAKVAPPQDAAAATTYAWVAYQGGNGVLARAALDRALASDPTHRLAVLLEHALDSGVHPAVLAEVGVRARLDRHRQGSRAEVSCSPAR